jgi:hypothetical protein
MTTTLADRIAARLEALGKNPSAAALEAGLGRSSVRDIIVNGANPRIDTLRKLTGPLQCSLEYLTGESDEPGERPPEPAGFGFLSKQNLLSKQRTRKAYILETGAFRPYGPGSPERFRSVDPLMINDMSYSGYRYVTAVVGDSSLRGLSIEEGDLLTIAKKINEPTPIRPGYMLYTSLLLRDADLSERTIRTVELVDGQVVLRSQGGAEKFRDIRLSDDPAHIDKWEREKALKGDFNMYATTDRHALIVFGVVVRVMRNFAPPV